MKKVYTIWLATVIVLLAWTITPAQWGGSGAWDALNKFLNEPHSWKATQTFEEGVVMRTTCLTSAGNIALTSAQQMNTYLEMTGAGTVSLAAGTQGDCLVIYVTGAFAVSIDPSGSQVITLNGADLAGGNKITSTSTAGDSVTLIFNGTKWRVIGTSTFTDGGA